jgi:putative transposase
MISLNKIYMVVGMSKQNFHKRLRNQLQEQESFAQLLPIVYQMREDHPGMSVRTMYWIIRPESIGRDRFEQLCHSNGFKLSIKRSFIKTTNSLGVTRFNKLTIDFKLIGINQIWVSDITYYRIGEKFYYLTFIMDLYSRYIVGSHASQSLQTINTTIPALKLALDGRKGKILPTKTILHSDGGGQYYCKEFLKLTECNHISNSMCESVYENANAERLNGTIKNQYIEGYAPVNFKALQQSLAKAVHMYNHVRPHMSLKGLTPLKFEKMISTKLLVVNKEKEAKRNLTTTTTT